MFAKFSQFNKIVDIEKHNDDENTRVKEDEGQKIQGGSEKGTTTKLKFIGNNVSLPNFPIMVIPHTSIVP